METERDGTAEEDFRSNDKFARLEFRKEESEKL